MTLEEAMKHRAYWWSRRLNAKSPEEKEFANRKWTVFVRQSEALRKSPTQQLCAVALEICKEDLTEKEAKVYYPLTTKYRR